MIDAAWRRADAVSAPVRASGPLLSPAPDDFTRAEWFRILGFYGVVVLLHVAGWGVYLHYASGYPPMVGLGLAAYLFGLRHAFDVDHIAAVDDTTRFLLQKGRRPLGVGFFFSLGHATVVLLLSVSVIFAADIVRKDLPALREIGGIIGSSVSGIFLLTIGFLNLVILLDTCRLWRGAKSGQHCHRRLEEMLRRRGLFNRVFRGRLQTVITHTWQMLPVGFLFGLGFDTASEIGLLGMSAGASIGSLPVLAGLSLPILFAAGMSAMDTTDGVLMVKAYEWAYTNPMRKILYNLTTTGLSIAVALFIGSIELLQVLVSVLSLKGPFFGSVSAFEFGAAGYFTVGAFFLLWVLSLALWKSNGLWKPTL